jgi:hypothetical protein
MATKGIRELRPQDHNILVFDYNIMPNKISKGSRLISELIFLNGHVPQNNAITLIKLFWPSLVCRTIAIESE